MAIHIRMIYAVLMYCDDTAETTKKLPIMPTQQLPPLLLWHLDFPLKPYFADVISAAAGGKGGSGSGEVPHF